MKKLIVIGSIACWIACLSVLNAGAQFYSYYYPNYYAPPGYVSPPPVRQNTPPSPYYFRATPDPYQMWRLDRNNRWQDYQNRLRSPLDPESDLSYMLRTFWRIFVIKQKNAPQRNSGSNVDGPGPIHTWSNKALPLQSDWPRLPLLWLSMLPCLHIKLIWRCKKQKYLPITKIGRFFDGTRFLLISEFDYVKQLGN